VVMKDIETCSFCDRYHEGGTLCSEKGWAWVYDLIVAAKKVYQTIPAEHEGPAAERHARALNKLGSLLDDSWKRLGPAPSRYAGILRDRALSCEEVVRAIDGWWREGTAPIHCDTNLIAEHALADSVKDALL